MLNRVSNALNLDNSSTCVANMGTMWLTYIVLTFLLSQARIKKIMQADEDVGKIALAVPLLVCK